MNIAVVKFLLENNVYKDCGMVRIPRVYYDQIMDALKEQEAEVKGFAIVKEPDCRICAKHTCRYYHDLRKPTECKNYERSDWTPKFPQKGMLLE